MIPNKCPMCGEPVIVTGLVGNLNLDTGMVKVFKLCCAKCGDSQVHIKESVLKRNEALKQATMEE